MLTITLEAEGVTVVKTRVVRDIRTLDITTTLLAVEAKDSLTRKLYEAREGRTLDAEQSRRPAGSTE